MNHSNNIIPITQETKVHKDSIHPLLIEKIKNNIHQKTPAILSAILDVLSDEQEKCTNNKKLALFTDASKKIKQSSEEINNLFIKNLKDNQNKKTGASNSAFSILDNHELEAQLMLQMAANNFITDNSYPLLQRLKNRLQNEISLYNLISPLHICTSFKKAISSLELTQEVEIIILHTLCNQLQNPLALLWEEADGILENSGFPELTNNNKKEYGAHKNETTTSKNDHKSLDKLTRNLLENIEHLTEENNENALSDDNKTTFDPNDLANKLSIIQIELISKLNSIEDLSESIKSSLESQGIHQRLSKRHQDLINLIGMLFEFILDDHQLHVDIRRLISLLQIPLLKLALFDSSFFTKRHHPARDLLNEITTVGMAYNGQTEKDVTLISLIEDTIRKIISNSNNKDIFAISLIEFRKKIDIINHEEKSKPDTLNQENNPQKEALKTVDNKSPALSPHQHEKDSTYFSNKEADDNKPSTETIEEIILESEKNIDSFILPNTYQPVPNADFEPIEGLNEGQWVQFIGGSTHSLPCKLSEIDREHNKYTFINRSGMKVSEKSTEELIDEIKNGHLIVEDNSSSFDRILKNVMDKFLRY